MVNLYEVTDTDEFKRINLSFIEKAELFDLQGRCVIFSVLLMNLHTSCVIHQVVDMSILQQVVQV